MKTPAREEGEKEAKVLSELSEIAQNVENVSIEKILSAGNVIVVIAEGDIGRLIGKNGRNIKQVAEKTGCKVKIVQKTGLLDMIAELAYPARIISTSRVYSPEGEKRRVILSKEDKRKIRLTEEEIERIVREVYGTNVEVSFG